MTNYQNFRVEDFVQDDFFISWVLHPTKTENDFWDQWLLEFPERRGYVEQARSILLAINATPVNPPVTDADVEDVMLYIDRNGYQEQPPERRVISMSWLRVAAILMVVITAGLLFYNKLNKPNVTPLAPELVQWIEFKNETSQSRIIRMADSSLAILKPNSVLKYPASFSDTTRNVFLEGEAFFEVHKDPAKAFLVHSQNMITRVLGTSFTVRAFKNDKNFKVIVNTGKVMVYTPATKAKASTPAVYVLPHQQVVLKRNESQLVKDTVATTMLLAKETAKKEFNFFKASIPEVIEKLETAYKVKIAYNGQQFENVTVTASLSDLPLDEKVKFICKAVNATCTFNNGQITILKN